MKSKIARTGVLSALLGSAVILAGCQSPAPPPAAVAPPPPKPAEPAGPPPIALSTTVTREAAAYQHYVRRAEALTPAFVDGESIQASLRACRGPAAISLA